MEIIAEPLNIGASDLLKGVEYTYCGGVYIQSETLLGRKWKSRYAIISQGCLYIYTNKNAKKTECSYSLKQFVGAVECGPENGEDICFCLRYKNARAPLIFSCDTLDRREKWIDNFCSEISEVQSTLYNVSADSGFGSAATVPKNRLKVHHGKEEPARYDEVKESHFKEATCSPVQACEDDRKYDFPKVLRGATSTDQDRFYENVETKHTNTTFQSEISRVKSKAFTNELKLTIGRRQANKTSMAEKGPLHTTKSLFAKGLTASSPFTESSFGSIRSAAEKSLSHLSVRRQESLYDNDTDGRRNSDCTSRKTISENAEELKSMKRFESYEYFCDQKEKAKRLLDRMTDGVFAVIPGESTKHNERVSLYRSHQCDTFPSLDDLLSYYSANELPAADYGAKLQKGYNSMS
ncbi:uncharacterized protein LOC123524186 isoform X2 [Mercenaria mercenaria]|uniref:uncharacterized protein LOC123524186 isoform X2 n=1 Tax=Mercenaria mercenaria TaxID=6596 RepID=UPI00234F870C|nr:uncharacterized protein LOC123524186 isoform X2 [Mercenaria mercenaria]